jgi:hypothetical protein
MVQPTNKTYAKGSHPQDLEAACGGLVLKRNQNFTKAEDDDMHPLGTGLNGPENTQTYAKKGAHGPRSNPQFGKAGKNVPLPSK